MTPRGILPLVRAACRAADPKKAVLAALRIKDSDLVVTSPCGKSPREIRVNLGKINRIVVIGAGKASPAMASGVEQVLGEKISAGLIVTKTGPGTKKQARFSSRLHWIEMIKGSHPVPGVAGRRGAKKIFSLLQNLSRNDLVLVLISGGASALLPLPAGKVTLRDKQSVTHKLLLSGAPIEEINAVRKHLSLIKGGQLARQAAPARVISLILSDVIGNPLDVIGSGPTVPDSSYYKDAVDVLKNHGIWSNIPGSVRRHLSAGRRGTVSETPKPQDAVFRRVHNVIIGDNRLAVEAVSHKVRTLGYRPFILTNKLRGEAAEAAILFGEIARRIRNSRSPFPPPVCLIAGGELTVTVIGKGKGGRCQEFVLAGAREIAGLRGCTIAAFGTDGIDGPTDAAGAIADEKTLQKAWNRGLELDQFLRRNDSYRFFRRLDKLIITGPTGTNVNDLYLLFIQK